MSVSNPDKIFQHGVLCNTVRFLDVGVGCSPLPPYAKAEFMTNSTVRWKGWYKTYWNRFVLPVDTVGTRWCEGALLVGWIHTRDLEAHPYKSLTLLALDVQV